MSYALPWRFAVPVATSFLLVVVSCAGADHAAVENEAAHPPQRTEAPAPAPIETKERAPKERKSVFAPLDLPTPNSWRLADGNPGPDYWQQQADYVIAAELNEETRLLRGHASITYTNNSPQDLDFIWLHLEQNLFKDNSLGALTSLPGARFSNRGDFRGGVTITSLTSGGQPLEYQVYDTLARIDLASPITRRQGNNPGRFTFEIGWEFTVPEYGVDRMGIAKFERGEVFEIAQWFPAVAAYDDSHGWNTLPYLGQGEFYNDFGDYDVKLTVPRSHLVAASGALLNEAEVLTPTQMQRLADARRTKDTVMIRTAEEVSDPTSRPAGNGPLTWHFKGEKMRTFAFATSAAFIWDAAGVDGKSETIAQSMYPQEAAELWSKSTDMLRFAIEGYNKRWFKYPYPMATNIFGCVGGMEYPMIIFCGDNASEEGLYGVTTHEIGHNWFPMLVNTDERRHAWMDEGFNSFINIYSEAERFHDGNLSRKGSGSAYLLRPGLPPMDIPADHYGPGLLGDMAYAKPAEALYLLREVVMGEERFDRAFREYIRRWAFKSPRPADFYRTMENVGGMDLAWFWRGWIVEARSLDQTVEAVEQRSDLATASITIGNLGDMVMPVIYKVTLDDGTSEVRKLPAEVWAWTDQWKLDVVTDGKRVVSVTLDPDDVLPDVDRRNNEWKVPPPEAPAEVEDAEKAVEELTPTR